MSSTHPDGAMVDLSLPISEAHPSHWPTHIPFQHKTFNWFESANDATQTLTDHLGPYATKWMMIDEHTGTHMDAPSHFIPPSGSQIPHAGAWGDVSADQIPLAQMTGPAVVIDAVEHDGEPGVSPIITVDDVARWEAVHGAISAGDMVIFRTGWDRFYLPGTAGAAYAHDVLVGKTAVGWSSPDESTIALLVEKGIRCVGTDAPTMGPAQGGQAVHVAGLGQGAVFIEALANLSTLPNRGATFMFLPLKTLNATGAPGRAIGFVPRGGES